MCVGAEAAQRILLCLHPAPFSGAFFETVMPLLASQRRVIAPDYPGYGASTAPSAEPDIAAYARSMLALAGRLAPDSAVDILGFHTGCLVGAEMALQAPGQVGQLVLVDVPYFVGEQQEKMLQAAGQPLQLDGGTDAITALWHKSVTAKLDAVPLERAVGLLAEQLRVASRGHLAFRAAFSYPCVERMALVAVPTHVIATQSALREATLACALQVPGAVLEERPDITRAVFEEGAAAIAGSINTVLESDR